MVRDSNYNGWIYIVKSGSVQVLKKLVHTEPSVNARTGEILQQTTDADIYWAFKTNRPTLSRLLLACGVDFPEPIADRVKSRDDTRDVTRDDTLTLLTDFSFGSSTPRLQRSLSAALIRTRGRGRHAAAGGNCQQTRSNTVIEFSGTPHSKRDYPLQLQKSE